MGSWMPTTPIHTSSASSVGSSSGNESAGTAMGASERAMPIVRLPCLAMSMMMASYRARVSLVRSTISPAALNIFWQFSRIVSEAPLQYRSAVWAPAAVRASDVMRFLAELKGYEKVSALAARISL